jgi:hypothetical protein
MIAINYDSVPFCLRDSSVMLRPSQSFLGFTAAYAQGALWRWDNLFRPFLRIAGAARESIEGEPDRCEMRGGGCRLRAVTAAADTILFEVECPAAVDVMIGPSGDHENFGGILEQEFMIYWGFTELQEGGGREIRVRHHSSTAVFLAEKAGLVARAAGWMIPLEAGIHRFALAVGMDADFDTLRRRAEEALARDADRLVQQHRTDWERLFARLPATEDARLRAKAEEAVWTMEASTAPAQGLLTDGFLCGAPTGYNKSQWLWDTCFAVRGYAAVAPERCHTWLAHFIQHQCEDGMLPGAISPWKSGAGTQVPLFAWAARALFAADGDREALRAAFATAVRNNDWWMAQGDEGVGGLPASGPISYDNSPLYDGRRTEKMNTGRLVNPDIIAALVNDCIEIAAMAETLGEPRTAASMRERAERLSRTAHEELFDEELDYYLSADGRNRLRIRVGPALTAIAFAPQAVARRLVETYVRPGSPAWPVHGIATVLADEPAYDPDNFWRGPIWGSTNRLAIDALERRGFDEAAARLRRETLSLMLESDGFHEIYHPVSGKGSRSTMMTGFGAGVFLDLYRAECASADRDPA